MLHEMKLDRSAVLNMLRDIPQSIETRAILLSQRPYCIVGVDPANCVIVEPCIGLATMIGNPEPPLLREALKRSERGCTLLATESQFELAREVACSWTWRVARRLIYSGHPVSRTEKIRTGLLDSPQILERSGFPKSVVGEIATRPPGSDVVASWQGSQLVSVCCATWETEGFWDLFVYTREGYRSSGFGEAATNLLIRRFAGRGKRAVWFTYTDNSPSLALAQKLGFRPVQRLYVFGSSTV